MKTHYLVRRCRSGRFNFTLLTSTGRLNGTVTVPVDGKSVNEIKQEACEKIRKLALEFESLGNAEMTYQDEASDEDRRVPTPAY
ncbi:hypothetical protein [Methylobacterium sp. CM6247]